MLSEVELKKIYEEEVKLLHKAYHYCDHEMIKYYDVRLNLIKEILE